MCINMCVKFQLHPLLDVEKKILRKIPFMLPWQPIQFSDLDKIIPKTYRNIQETFLKKVFRDIPCGTAKMTIFYFSHCKNMGTISSHSNKSE